MDLNYCNFCIQYSHIGIANKEIINLNDIFSIFKLSERFPASQVNEKQLSNKSVKLYTPSILYETYSSNSINKNTIIDWSQNKIRVLIDNENRGVVLDTTNNLSFLVKLQAEAKDGGKIITAEILSISDSIACFRLTDNTVHYDVPITNIVTQETDIKTIKTGDIINIYDYTFIYGILILLANGDIRLYSNYIGNNNRSFLATLQLCYLRLEDFFDQLNLTSYLINNLEKFSLKASRY